MTKRNANPDPALSNVDAIYAEYPFLDKLFPRGETSTAHSTAQVRRCDDRFLQRSLNACLGNLYLIDGQGQIITRLGERRWVKFLTRNEDVAQALVRIGDKAHRGLYAVEYCPKMKVLGYGYSGLADAFILLFGLIGLCSYYPSKLCLWKLPKGFKNMAEYLRSRMEKDRNAIRQL